MIIPGLLYGPLSLIVVLFQAEQRSYRITNKTEEQLMAELQTIMMDGVALAALEYPEVCDDANGLDPWTLVGGLRGLRNMQVNSRLLLALAIQAQTWNRQSNVVALQQMKKELKTIRNSVLLSRWDRFSAKDPKSKGLRAHTAAYAYYRMTEMLLDMYRHSPSRLYTHLQDALWRGHDPTLSAI